MGAEVRAGRRRDGNQGVTVRKSDEARLLKGKKPAVPAFLFCGGILNSGDECETVGDMATTNGKKCGWIPIVGEVGAEGPMRRFSNPGFHADPKPLSKI